MPESASRILVVDDDPAFRTVVARILTAGGHQVREAESLAAALTALDEPGGFDLLLTDLQLAPGSPQGVSVAREIQQRSPGLPVIFMTGGHPDGHALAVPEDNMLQKPFRRDRLLSAVRSVLERS